MTKKISIHESLIFTQLPEQSLVESFMAQSPPINVSRMECFIATLIQPKILA